MEQFLCINSTGKKVFRIEGGRYIHCKKQANKQTNKQQQQQQQNKTKTKTSKQTPQKTA